MLHRKIAYLSLMIMLMSSLSACSYSTEGAKKRWLSRGGRSEYAVDVFGLDGQKASLDEALPPKEAESVSSLGELKTDYYFGLNSDHLSKDDFHHIDSILASMLDHPNYRLKVEGHTDERGTHEYNIALGYRRAEAIQRHILAQGIDASRLMIVSYGQEKPASPGHDETAWSQNRRAHLVLTSG